MLNKIIQKSEAINKNLNQRYGGYSWRGTDCTIFENVLMVTAWFDDHDDDIFVNFIIPNEKLNEEVKKEILDYCDDIMDTDDLINPVFDMDDINSIFENNILLEN